jgi:hypothetical protein
MASAQVQRTLTINTTRGHIATMLFVLGIWIEEGEFYKIIHCSTSDL